MAAKIALVTFGNIADSGTDLIIQILPNVDITDNGISGMVDFIATYINQDGEESVTEASINLVSGSDGPIG